jgi:predicted trehalose synthase
VAYEATVNAARAEIRAQRDRIATLMGQIRDLVHEWPRDGAQRITAENTTLQQRVRHLPRRTGSWRNGCKPPAPAAGSPIAQLEA